MHRLGFLATVLLFVSVSSCGGTDSDAGDEPPTPSATELEQAYSGCLVDNPRIQLADDGHALIADGLKGDVGIKALVCILAAVGMPQSVAAAMDSTTALMGRQEQTAGDYKYEWSYHPDNGLDVIVTDGTG